MARQPGQQSDLLLRIDKALRAAIPASGPCACLGYADDTFIEGPAQSVEAVWAKLLGELETDGHTAQPSKCNLWAAGDVHRSDDDASALRRLAFKIHVTQGMLAIMGTEAGEAYRTAAGPYGTGADHAAARADKAIELCMHIKELATTDIGISKLSVAWALLIKCAARALDFDARVVPPESLRPHAARLDVALRSAAEAVLGKQTSEAEWDQVCLPGPLSGCGLRLPTRVLEPAFWASWVANESRVRATCEQHGRPFNGVEWQAQVAVAATGLEQNGVAVFRDLPAEFTPLAKAEEDKSPWVQHGRAPIRAGGETRQMSQIL